MLVSKLMHALFLTAILTIMKFLVFENFKWILMLGIFLGGLSLHVSQALLAHMFEVNMVVILLTLSVNIQVAIRANSANADMGGYIKRSRIFKLFH